MYAACPTLHGLARNSYRAYRELIAGRILKTMKDEEGPEVQRSAAEIMAEAILEGMQGELVLRSDEKGVTYSNPLHAVKLYQDHMLKAKELALRRHRRAEADVVPSVRRNGGSSYRQPSGQVPGRRPESPPVHSPS